MTSHSPAAHVVAFSEMSDPSSAEGQGARIAESLNPLHMVKARLQVCLGDAYVTVGELLALREHQVIALNQTVDAPVEVLLEGRVVARGQLVAVDDQFAVRVTELPVALKV